MSRSGLLGIAIVLAAGSPAWSTDFHVNKGVACNDSNAGTTAQPLCTVQAGLNKLSAGGDQVIIHTGVYAECAILTKSGLRGTATSPVRIKGADGENPANIVIDASGLDETTCLAATGSCDTAIRRGALTLKGTWGAQLGYIQVQNLTVRPPNLASTVTKNNGIDLQCVDHVELTGIRSDMQPTFSGTDAGAEGGDGIINVYNSQNILISGADFSNGGTIRPGFHAVIFQDTGTKDVAVVNSKVRDLDGGFVCQSGGTSRIDVLFNDVSNMNAGCDGQNLIQDYNLDFLRISYNRFAGNGGLIIRPRSYSVYPSHSRLIVENNLFRARAGGQTAVEFGYAADPDSVWLGIFRNNIFSGYSVAFSYLTSTVKDCDVTENNNAFYNVGTVVSDASGCGFTKGANSQTLSTNPLGANDCPATSSPIVNAGSSNSSTPKRGVGMVDIGACESGETAGAWLNPYDFQPKDSTSSSSPKITWDGASDTNVNLTDLDFTRFLKGTAQTQYECQLDTSYTFNSQGIGKPIWASGAVASTATSCTVGVSLASGDYFARVRLNGQMWSDPFKFTVSGSGGPVCGNGVKETGEACDGSDLGGQTCLTQGFTSGTLSCTAACALSTSACSNGSGGGTLSTSIDFLDVTSAPVGSYVTLRGHGFGAVQGTSKVYFGTVAATAVPVWSDTKIVAQVPTGAGGPVKATVGAVNSNTVAFSTHTGRILWVAKTGSDTNACTSSSAPCLTINKARTVAVAGDVVLVHSGSYCESSGGAGLYVRVANSGTTTQPITYRNYPGEQATVDCCGLCGGNTVYLEGDNIQVSGLRSTGAKGTGFVVTGAGDRIADCESFGNNQPAYASTSGSGINIQIGSNNAKVLGCSIHDNGSVDNLDHGMYVKGQNMEIAYNTIFNHALGYGMQLYEGSGTTFTGAKVYSNLIYANRNGGITVNNGAVGAEVYNNEIRGNTRNGIYVGSGGTALPTGAKVYNNTISGNDTAAAGYPQIRITNGSGHIIKNNVVTGTNLLMVWKDATATSVTLDRNQYGSNASNSFQWNGASSNFTGWKTASGQDAASAVGDPLYVNLLGNNLHLMVGSPAIDSADGTMAPPIDRDHTPRPQGIGPDRGAYEFGGTGGVPPDTTPPAQVPNLMRTDKH